MSAVALAIEDKNTKSLFLGDMLDEAAHDCIPYIIPWQQTLSSDLTETDCKNTSSLHALAREDHTTRQLATLPNSEKYFTDTSAVLVIGIDPHWVTNMCLHSRRLFLAASKA